MITQLLMKCFYFLKKPIVSSIGSEYMHISDPVEKKWFRERMEKEENKLNFTDKWKKSYFE